ncbi:MAG: hypothetical protein ACOC04_01770 [Halothece sp.]
MLTQNFELTGSIVVFIALLQLLLITIIGLTFRILIKLFYTKLNSSYQIFPPENYTPNANGFPEKYSFVVVKYSSNGRIISETFYTLLGDWTQIKYLDSGYPLVSTFFFSNILLILFPSIGIILLIISNYQELSTDHQTIFQTINLSDLKSCGKLLFIPTLISGAIKLVFDFIYIKLFWRRHRTASINC